MIPGLTGDAASPYLEEFSHKLVRSLKMLPIDDAENWQQGLVKVPKPYISAYEESGATVSGPPAILDLLLQSKKLPKASSIKFCVNGPYHALHLHDSRDVEQIFAADDSFSGLRQESRIPFFLSTGSKTKLGTPLTALFRTVVSEILMAPLRLDKISKSLATRLTRGSVQSCVILPVATLAAQFLSLSSRKPVLPKPTSTSRSWITPPAPTLELETWRTLKSPLSHTQAGTLELKVMRPSGRCWSRAMT